MQLPTHVHTFDGGVLEMFLGSNFAIIFFELSPLVLAQSFTSEQFLVEIAKASPLYVAEVLGRICFVKAGRTAEFRLFNHRKFFLNI